MTEVLAALAAMFSALTAYGSYRLNVKLREELRSDEVIIASRVIHPGLGTKDHDDSVIMCTLFNKSKRKAYVNKVSAYGRTGNKMDVTWSSLISPLGQPEKAGELIGIVDTANLFLRQDDGKEISYCRLEIFHSFSDNPLVALFDPVSEFAALLASPARTAT